MKPKILMERYQLGRLLGQGTFAKVYHARNFKTGESVAIKAMDKEKILNVQMMEQIKREIWVMRLVRHPNIVRLYEVMATKSKIYIVMEYVEGGDLFDRVVEKGRLKEEEARRYFQQLIRAVDFCHSRSVYHRDLKPENVLLDGNGDVKVSDFGLSALPQQFGQDGLLHTACGTPAYVAPEVITKKGYDGAKADIWSCGVILFVLMAGYLPFQEANLMAMYKKIYKGDFKCPPWFSSEVRTLILRLLDPKPQTRITIAQLMQVPWFQRGLKRPQTHKDVDVGSVFFTPKLTHLNAFDIISQSPAFNLSGLFKNEVEEQEEESRFTSTQPASSIMLKLEEIARLFRFSFKKSEDCNLKLQGSPQGRKGPLCIDVEIFELNHSLLLVELLKTEGDTLEYSEFYSHDLKPGLKDIVWTWDGDSKLNK